MPASAGIERKRKVSLGGLALRLRRDASRIKIVEGVQKCKNTRERGDATEEPRLSVKILTDRKLDKNAASPILRQGV